MHSPRTILLQTLGHFVLDHETPRDFADFLRQRVEANYFAAAVLVPERPAARFLSEAKQARQLSVEDLRDVFSVSYEMAAHRFTNLATHHLGLTCHFVKNDEAGVIYKAYENDGLVLPADASGAIEGQRMCRQWCGRQVFSAADRFTPCYQYTDTPSGTYWCVSHVDPGRERGFAITLGVTVRAFPVVPRPGHGHPPGLPVPGRRLLPAAAEPGWPGAGREWPGRRPVPTRTSCPRCPPGASPAWTRPTCTSSWSATTRADAQGPGQSADFGWPGSYSSVT